MKRTNLIRFYRLGKIAGLRELKAGHSFDDFFEETFLIAVQLEAFVESEENQRNLPRAVEKAAKLEKTLAELGRDRRSVTDTDVSTFNFMLSQFESSLDDDLARCHTYEVDPVGAYSFDRLIGAADKVFPETLKKIIPEQVSIDFRAAGRCLAFDLPTACAFHAFRATDATLREYCKHFNAIPKGNSRDWGTFIRALRDILSDTGVAKKPNGRTVELIDSIRAQDRNPLVHPELNLDSDGALLMFDLCKNAVSLMVTDIRNSP